MVEKKRLVLDIEKRWRFLREVILFCAGLSGISYEAVIASNIRVELLAIYCGMCGLPLFLRWDEKGQKGD